MTRRTLAGVRHHKEPEGSGSEEHGRIGDHSDRHIQPSVWAYHKLKHFPLSFLGSRLFTDFVMQKYYPLKKSGPEQEFRREMSIFLGATGL